MSSPLFDELLENLYASPFVWSNLTYDQPPSVYSIYLSKFIKHNLMREVKMVGDIMRWKVALFPKLLSGWTRRSRNMLSYLLRSALLERRRERERCASRAPAGPARCTMMSPRRTVLPTLMSRAGRTVRTEELTEKILQTVPNVHSV